MRKLASKHCPWKIPVAIADCTFNVGDESEDARTVSIQLRDDAGVPIKHRGAVNAWMSDANGKALAEAPSGGVTAGANGAVHDFAPEIDEEVLENVSFRLVSSSSGLIDVVVSAAGVVTHYLTLELPNGTLKTVAVAFA